MLVAKVRGMGVWAAGRWGVVSAGGRSLCVAVCVLRAGEGVKGSACSCSEQ